jgi:uncharacterized protein YjiS (DUF1127 family)
MSSIAKAFAKPARTIHWPRFNSLWIARKRRQTTVDLIHSSPHLLRDIGLTEGQIFQRRR